MSDAKSEAAVLIAGFVFGTLATFSAARGDTFSTVFTCSAFALLVGVNLGRASVGPAPRRGLDAKRGA